MEIKETRTIRLVATEGCYLTEKSVEADNFRTFSQSLTLEHEEDAANYEEWTEERMREFSGDAPIVEPNEEEEHGEV